MVDMVEIIMSTEVAGANHDAFVAKSFANKVRIDALDVKSDISRRFRVDEMNLGRARLEKIEELLAIIP